MPALVQFDVNYGSSSYHFMITGFILTFCTIAYSNQASLHGEFEEIFSWKTMEIIYDDLQQKQADLASGAYKPENFVIVDADFYEGQYYVSTTPMLTGSPVSLSVVTSQRDSNGSFMLKPFPNWSWHNRSSCNSIISITRIRIDKFGRMWLIDIGSINLYSKEEKVVPLCPPKLLVFDLKNNNSLIRRFEFPADQRTLNSVIVNLELQINDESGEDTIVYAADAFDYKVRVYNFAKNESFAVDHPYFYFEPEFAFRNLAGVNTSLDEGIYTLSLDTKKDLMYFHAPASDREYYVNAALLRKGNLTETEKREFRQFSYKKSGRSTVEIITPDGAYLIFPILEEYSVYAWNTSTCYDPQNFQLLIKDEVRLQYISGLKLVGKDLQDLLIVSNRLQNVVGSGRNEEGMVNFRIFQGHLSKFLN